MLCHTILALCGATVVIAQSTTAGSPFLSIIGAVDNYRVSTIGSDATHTTYLLTCQDQSADTCDFPPNGATLVNGPSSVAYYYYYEQVSYSFGCQAQSDVATCIMSEGGPGLSSLSDSSTIVQTVTMPASDMALDFTTAAATDATGSVTTTAIASAGASAAPATAGVTTTGATTSISATGSAASGSESATETGANVSSTSAAKTGGAARFGAVNARWAIGAVLVGLGLIL